MWPTLTQCCIITFISWQIDQYFMSIDLVIFINEQTLPKEKNLMQLSGGPCAKFYEMLFLLHLFWKMFHMVSHINR